MSGIRKLVCFFTLILSLLTLIGMIYVISDLAAFMGLSFDLESFLNEIENSTIKEIAYKLSMLMFVALQVLGIPLIIFLVSLIGLTIKDRRITT